MNGPSKLATIKYSTCSVLLEVYPQDLPGEPWNTLDEGPEFGALLARGAPALAQDATLEPLGRAA